MMAILLASDACRYCFGVGAITISLSASSGRCGPGLLAVLVCCAGGGGDDGVGPRESCSLDIRGGGEDPFVRPTWKLSTPDSNEALLPKLCGVGGSTGVSPGSSTAKGDSMLVVDVLVICGGDLAARSHPIFAL